MNTKHSRLAIPLMVALLAFAAPFAVAQQAKLDRVEKLPAGAQINVLGTFFSTENKVEFTFDAPLGSVWAVIKKVARDFDKDSKRRVVAIDEQTNRVQNGKIDQMAMATAGAWGPFVDEFVMEATRVSDTQTKVLIIRTVMQRESGAGWGPQKSNGRIEQYLLTQIADNLKNPPPADLAAGTTSTANQTGAAPPLTNNQIMRMIAARLPDDVIIATIRSSTPTFDLAPEDLIKLKEGGVSDTVLKVMMDARAR